MLHDLGIQNKNTQTQCYYGCDQIAIASIIAACDYIAQFFFGTSDAPNPNSLNIRAVKYEMLLNGGIESSVRFLTILLKQLHAHMHTTRASIEQPRSPKNSPDRATASVGL